MALYNNEFFPGVIGRFDLKAEGRDQKAGNRP